MKSQYIKYDPALRNKARELRKNSTLSEVLLWNELKRKQMRGYDFHRQKPIGSYIIDFFCPKLMLAIEIDGTSHMFTESKDERRQRELEAMGIHFIRVDDLDVKFRMGEVLKVIESWIEVHAK